MSQKTLEHLIQVDLFHRQIMTDLERLNLDLPGMLKYPHQDLKDHLESSNVWTLVSY